MKKLKDGCWGVRRRTQTWHFVSAGSKYSICNHAKQPMSWLENSTGYKYWWIKKAEQDGKKCYYCKEKLQRIKTSKLNSKQEIDKKYKNKIENRREYWLEKMADEEFRMKLFQKDCLEIGRQKARELKRTKKNKKHLLELIMKHGDL